MEVFRGVIGGDTGLYEAVQTILSCDSAQIVGGAVHVDHMPSKSQTHWRSLRLQFTGFGLGLDSVGPSLFLFFSCSANHPSGLIVVDSAYRSSSDWWMRMSYLPMRLALIAPKATSRSILPGTTPSR